MNLSKIKNSQITIIKSFIILILISGCVTTKKKGEVSKLGKFYHNVNSEYNGYFNANELMIESEDILVSSRQDNYTKILDVIDYASISDPKVVYPQLNKAIEKVSRVANLHEKGDWVDDCYVLMGKAQYMKKDYASTVETMEYFQNAFNPANPYGRNYQKIRLKGGNKEIQKERENERKEKAKEVEDERKVKAKEREDAKEAQEKLRKEQQKEREEAAKARKSSSNSRTSGTRARTNGTTSRTTKPTTTKPKPAPVIKDTIAASTNEVASTAKKVEDKKTEKKPVEYKAPKQISDGTSYYEGLLYLAQGYTRLQKFSNAEYLLKRIKEVSGHTKAVKRGLAPAFADLMVQSERYDEAIPYLEEAIKTAKKKELKGRYNFIIAQILQERGDHRSASEYFTQAGKKSGGDFKMRFMSELYSVKNSALAGGRSASDVAGKLEKMLSEVKNAAYKDQIYFALGEIEISRNNEPKALEYFTKSVASNTNNPGLKAEAYYVIADMYLTKKRYDKAKNYIDSTLMNMTEEDNRLDGLTKQGKSIASSAKHMAEVFRYDTLIAMSLLPEKELRKIAEKRKSDMNTAAPPAQAQENNANPKSSLGKTYNRSIMGSSSFFAYDNAQVLTGMKEFKELWGPRKNEDNWRRSNKSFSNEASSNESEANNTQKTRSDRMTDEEFKKLIADIPTDSEVRDDYKQKLGNELFFLGNALKIDLDDSELSAKYLERLLAQHPKHPQELDALYVLYRNYRDQNDMTNAKRIADLLQSKYPDTDYAKIVADPSYAAKLVSEKLNINQYYDQTYLLFEKGNYESALAKIEGTATVFGNDNPLAAKFSLLKAMIVGKSKGKEAYLESLKETIIRYPNTPEETKAKEMERFLKGDETAFKTVDAKEVDEEFVSEEKERHYVVVVLFDYSDKVLQDAKIAVNDYNQQYYKNDRFEMGEQTLSKDENTQVLLIRSFENFSKAHEYYVTAYKNPDLYIPKSVVAFEMYPITQRNFRKMISQKTHTKYRVFFQNKY
jgi:tetratricopeptide (TPR) repeat protein